MNNEISTSFQTACIVIRILARIDLMTKQKFDFSVRFHSNINLILNLFGRMFQIRRINGWTTAFRLAGFFSLIMSVASERKSVTHLMVRSENFWFHIFYLNYNEFESMTSLCKAFAQWTKCIYINKSTLI